MELDNTKQKKKRYHLKSDRTNRLRFSPRLLAQKGWAFKNLPIPKIRKYSTQKLQHKMPSVEELSHHLAEAKIFSKLDATTRFWSVHPDRNFWLLTTFQLPHGKYCFQRLTFGLDIFQMKMDQILEQIDGAVGIANGITAKSEEEHDKILQKLIKVR